MDWQDNEYLGFEESQQEDSQKKLSSYSDLFVAVSFIFLFLFVVGTLQSGIQSVADKQKADKQEKQFNKDYKEVVEHYEKILASYKTDRDNYLNTNSTDDEKRLYKEVLAKLEMIEKEKRAMKDKHQALADRAAAKQALINNFTKTIREVMTSNIVLKKTTKEVEQEKKQLQENLDKFKTETESDLREEYSKQITAKKDELEVKKTKEVASIQQQNKKDYEKKLKNLLQEKENLHQSKLQAEMHKAEALKKEIVSKEKEIALYQQKLELNAKGMSEATKLISDKIATAFEKANIKAKIDSQNGEVTLNFEETYFGLGKHELKKSMKKKLDQVIPIYAKAVFENKAIIDRIDHLEIIGYSSPIFGGKVVNPKELNAKNFWGINYNLDLSYRRARSIFKHVFNPNAKKFSYKKDMFQMTKVSGRSYLEGRAPASSEKKTDLKTYCKKYNCNEQQKVVIKFTLKY